jgi:hypothetical protein
MRASLEEVVLAMKSRVPKVIYQQPFDYDPAHYGRLCDLRGRQPDRQDLIDYALDLTYMELQPDLLRYLIPVLLDAWRRDLFEAEAAGLGAFVEYFWPALQGGQALPTLSDEQRASVVLFMRDTILDRMDTEDRLAFSGMGASAYQWVRALGSFGIVFPDMQALWTEWWQMKTSGQAVAAFQYASALMYEDKENPIFTPWTPDKGGGAPALWEPEGFLYDVGWQEQNLQFLRRTLSVEYIEQGLQRAQRVIENPAAKLIASKVLVDLQLDSTRLSLRIEELPTLLTNVSNHNGFTV